MTGVQTCALPICNVLSDITLTADGVYVLSGPVFVGTDGGAAPADRKSVV